MPNSTKLQLQGGQECRLRRAAVAGQQVFMERLVKLVKMVARESGNRKKKVMCCAMLRQTDVDGK